MQTTQPSNHQHKFALFYANKRGFISLNILCFLLFFSLFSEFIANDQPLVVQYKNTFYFPIIEFIPETTYGGFFETEADYTDPFVIETIQEEGWMIWPVIRYSYNTLADDLDAPAPTPPDHKHLLGTDDEARDVLARLLYGFRISILFGLILTVISSMIGVTVGLIQGYFGGMIDLLGQRVIEIWNGMPVFFLLLILVSFIQPNFTWLLFLMLLFSWTGLVNIVRAEVLRTRNLDYVRAARALGVSDFAIMRRHILPNALVATLTFLPFIASSSIVMLTSLDFLGFGLPPESPSLGEMLKQGKENLDAPWLGITVFIALTAILAMLVFIGEAVRDAFDPRKT